MMHTYDTLLERDASEEFDRLHPDLSVERSFRGDQILIEALPGSSNRLSSVFIYSTRVEEGGKWLPAISLLVRPQESPENRRQDITIPCHDPSRYIVDGYMGPDMPVGESMAMARDGVEVLSAYASLSPAERDAVDAGPSRRVTDLMAPVQVRYELLAACVGALADMNDIHARDVLSLWYRAFPDQQQPRN